MRRTAVIILTLALCIIMCSCSESSKINKYSQTEFVLGTVVTLTVYDEDESTLNGAFSLCRQYEDMLSSTIEGSDVWNINHAGGQPVDVSNETAELVKLSLDYSRLTDGAFDITIAPLTTLWNFSGEYPSVPEKEAIDALLPLVDYTAVSVDGNTVTVPSGCSIELGAIAKGYISDKLREYFKDSSVNAALINLGGNVATVGTKPDGTDWEIGIRNPQGASSDSIGSLFVKETTIVTSGIYERCFEENGVLYHHILSSDDGYPVNNDIASVTVICESGADADALSTSLYLMGFEDGFEYAQSKEGLEAVFILADGHIHCTDGAELT